MYLIRIRKIDHVALHVDDVAATSAFYTEVLGLAAGTPPSMTPEMVALISHLKAVTKTSGPTEGMWVEPPGGQVHLIRAEKTEDRVNPFGPHLAFEVEDFDDAKQILTGRGLSFVEAPDGSPFRQLWVLDPSGNTVELWMKG